VQRVQFKFVMSVLGLRGEAQEASLRYIGDTWSYGPSNSIRVGRGHLALSTFDHVFIRLLLL